MKTCLSVTIALIAFSFIAYSQPRKETARTINGEMIEYLIDDTPATFSISIPDRVEGRNPKKLYASYAEAAAAMPSENILPSFEQIVFVGRAADSNIIYDGKSLLGDENIPERKKVIWNFLYKKRLENPFSSVITQAREINISRPEKEDIIAVNTDMLKLYISPHFDVEPLPSHYQRMAGTDFFHNISLLASDNIGLYGLYDLRLAKDFVTNWKNMPEMKQDMRAITKSGQDSYLMVLGVEPIVIEAKYEKRPLVYGLRKDINVDVNYGVGKYTLLVPVVVKITTKNPPPGDDKFRMLCDRYKTKEAIVNALAPAKRPAGRH